VDVKEAGGSPIADNSEIARSKALTR